MASFCWLEWLSWRRWFVCADLACWGHMSVHGPKPEGRIDDPARRDWQRWCARPRGRTGSSSAQVSGMKLLWTDLGNQV
ncbi:MAG: hypothetical protein ACLR0P_13690 [Oscillospiraceae bacterium]